MLTEEIVHEIQNEVSRARQPQHVCIDALLMVKNHYGWVSDEQIRELAAILSMTVEELERLATSARARLEVKKK